MFQSIISEVSPIYLLKRLNVTSCNNGSTTTTSQLANLESSWDCLDPSPAPGGNSRLVNHLRYLSPNLEDGKSSKLNQTHHIQFRFYIYIYILILEGCKKNHKKILLFKPTSLFQKQPLLLPPLFSDAKTLQQSSWNELSSDDLENYAKYLVSSAAVS